MFCILSCNNDEIRWNQMASDSLYSKWVFRWIRITLSRRQKHQVLASIHLASVVLRQRSARENCAALIVFTRNKVFRTSQAFKELGRKYSTFEIHEVSAWVFRFDQIYHYLHGRTHITKMLTEHHEQKKYALRNLDFLGSLLKIITLYAIDSHTFSIYCHRIYFCYETMFRRHTFLNVNRTISCGSRFMLTEEIFVRRFALYHFRD